MGADAKRAPPLPAPTETDTGTDLATDLSRATEKSSQTLPEDGSPVTISGKKKKHDRDGEGLTRASHQSQTSLLIEYFEGGKSSQAESRRPSVRVKVTPSSKSKNRSANEHIQITETKGTRKPSYTRRINLSPREKSAEAEGDNKSVSSLASATEESNVSRNPIEIEVMPKRHGSPLIPTREGNSRDIRIQPLGSDISSMPADSLLDGKTRSLERKRSRSLTRGEALAAGAVTGLAAGAIADTLRTPSRRRSRSLSRERIVAQKAVEKIKGDKSERRKKHVSGSRSRSVSNSEKHPEATKSPRRRSSRNHGDESIVSGGETSQITGSRLSTDQRSFHSGTSKSSINNPKLLEAVEDAIRRLILPELTALKNEQKASRSKSDRERRESVTSGSTGVSRDSRDDLSSTRRVSNRKSATDVSTNPKVTVDGREVLAGDSRKVRKERHDSPRDIERGASEETIARDEVHLRNKNSSERRTSLGALAAGLGLGALTATALHNHSRESLDERQERRRRRAKSRSRSGSMAESYDEESEHHKIRPPMPLMSDINASEVTRSSILSADTERPTSASAERLMTPVKDVRKGYVSPSQTPTRSPISPHQLTPTRHGNPSRGELSRQTLRSRESHEQEYELDEHEHNIPAHDSHEPTQEDEYVEDNMNRSNSRALEASALAAAAGGLIGAVTVHHQDRQPEPFLEDEESEYYQQTGEVPPPLRYVPYNAQKRGLSPIQSVSGCTEDENVSYHQTRNSGVKQNTGSYSTLDQSPQHQRSVKSIYSDQSALRQNRHEFAEVHQEGMADSEITQDGDYWEEQHRENDRNRDLDGDSLHGYKRNTNYTDESFDGPDDEKVTAGQSVQGIGANPNYVHMPVAVESAVASLVSASVLTGGSGQSNLGRRESYASYDEGSEQNFTSRGNSPQKNNDRSRDLEYSNSDRHFKSGSNSPQKYDEQPRDVQYSSTDREVIGQRNSPVKYPEYELDDEGRKVTMPNYRVVRDSTVAGSAAGMAAAAGLSDKHAQDMDSPSQQYKERINQTAVPLQKSFKDRAKDLQDGTPRQSVEKIIADDEVKMTANFIPNVHDPMPEIGYGDEISEADTNLSYIKSPLGGRDHGNRDHWPNLETPPQPKPDTSAVTRTEDKNSLVKTAEDALGLGFVGTGAIALANHERETDQDHDEQWNRTSEERKRDTLITNPYEGTSPITLLGGPQDRNLLGQMGYNGVDRDYTTGSPGALPKDEGYISSAPNARSPGAATPEQRAKGVGFMDDVGMGAAASALAGDDPFYTPKHTRHLSGMSHGMESPLYDSATGNGMDRIKSRDIVALMDHLTVRDAQRSARDTEILVTLVRAAAETRNSFEDIKRLLADTEDVIITETQRNTDRSVQKVINGPRPPPPSGSRSLRGSQDGAVDDLPSKKRNVFQRALKGLSMRSSNDLAKIEDMLVQLLSEVEGLKVAQGLPFRSNPSDTFENMQQEGAYEQDHGYEPEGNAGTSTASQSGHFSNPLSRGASASRIYDGRKFSENRISTVPEGDEEELDTHEKAVLANQFEKNEQLLTPTREAIRGGSAPPNSPPQQYIAPTSLSNENTPRTDKGKKHKSGSSSGWIPRISRWSETTASTVARGFRSSGRRETATTFEQTASRSGSDLGNYETSPHDPYSEDKLHSGFSEDHISQPRFDENNPQLTSLLPPEDPKYKAHRNSLNLQHPQPRPGPTHRYQTALETQAQDFDSPMSPKSMDWGSSTSVNRLPPNANRFSSGTNGTDLHSQVSEGAYISVEGAPERPPKEPLSSPPGPERTPKIRNRLAKPSPLSHEHLNADNFDDKRFSHGTVSTAAGQAYESPRSSGRLLSPNLGVPARKPTGPRSMGERSRSGNLSPTEVSGGEGQTVRQRKRDTFGTIASNHSVESETF